MAARAPAAQHPTSATATQGKKPYGKSDREALLSLAKNLRFPAKRLSRRRFEDQGRINPDFEWRIVMRSHGTGLAEDYLQNLSMHANDLALLARKARSG
jgi:hypothetical protein